MATDTRSETAFDLSPRATLARLTLEVRAARRDAEVAEEAVAQRERTDEPDVHDEHLRDRLMEVLDRRRATLADELAQHRRDAERRITDLANDRRSSVLTTELVRSSGPTEPTTPFESIESVAAEPCRAAEPCPPAVPVLTTTPSGSDDDLEPAPTLVPLTGRSIPSIGDVNFGDEFPALIGDQAIPAPEPDDAGPPPADAPTPVLPSRADEFPPPPSSMPPPPLFPSPPGTGLATTGQQTVTIDPESFARAVAVAVAAVLDARPNTLPQGQWYSGPQAPAPRRESFWAGLWHADIFLAVLAMAIVLVILLAWST